MLDHWPERCAACDEPFAAGPVGQAYGGYDEIEVRPADPNAPGLRLWVTQHRFWEAPCGCGHCSRHQPPRALVLPEWQGARVAAQQMLGPLLAGLIVMLCLRYRLSRAKVRELLWELLGLQLSAGLIDQTLRQSAGQVAPVEDLLLEEIERAGLLHLDETPWRESGQWLWLWVFNAVTTVVYFIGARSAEIFVNALQGGFGGCLMSDGYAVYRSYLNRIRCLAHLLRKARGLAEATCRHTSQVGQQLLDLMGGLIQAIQAARDGPSDDLAERQAPALAQLQGLVRTPPTQSLRQTRRILPGDAQRLGSDHPAATRPQPAAHQQCGRTSVAPLGHRPSPELRYPQRARNSSVCAARQHHRYLSRKEGVRLGLPHRRPSGRPPRTTDAAFARRLGRGVIGYDLSWIAGKSQPPQGR